MVQLLERLGVPWNRRQGIFDPIGKRSRMNMDAFLACCNSPTACSRRAPTRIRSASNTACSPAKFRDAGGRRSVSAGLSAGFCRARPMRSPCICAARGPQRTENSRACLALDRNPRRHESAERIARRQPPDGPADAARRNSLAMPYRCSTNFARRLLNEITPGHHPMVFGMVGGVLGWPRWKWPARISIRRALRWSARRCALAARPARRPANSVDVRPFIAKLAEEVQDKT